MHDMLIIIGASGHGKVCADIAERMNRWKEIKFLDDDINKTQILNYEIIGNSTDFTRYRDVADFFVAVGNNESRQEIFQILVNADISITTLKDPSSVVGNDVIIGIGTVLMPGVIINSSTKVGDGVILNTNSSVDHDCSIDDFVHISPGVTISGTVSIGQLTWIGSGSTIINNIHITDKILLGAGSLVICDLNESGKYYGSPAKVDI